MAENNNLVARFDHVKTTLPRLRRNHLDGGVLLDGRNGSPDNTSLPSLICQSEYLLHPRATCHLNLTPGHTGWQNSSLTSFTTVTILRPSRRLPRRADAQKVWPVVNEATEDSGLSGRGGGIAGTQVEQVLKSKGYKERQISAWWNSKNMELDNRTPLQVWNSETELTNEIVIAVLSAAHAATSWSGR